MKFLLLAAFFVSAMAVPTGGGGGGGGDPGHGGGGGGDPGHGGGGGGDPGHGGGGGVPSCPSGGLFTNAQCCATDVLGLADLDCHTPSAAPRNPAEFKEICSKAGQRARCCVIPVAGQAVLCTAPLGT